MAEPASRNSAVSQSCDFNNFAKSLMCPVQLTPLKDAVILTPCGHTISEVAANSMYCGTRDINGNEIVETKKLCPLCRRTVQAYYPNLIMRSLVESTLGVKLEEPLPAASAIIKADEEKDLDSIPFPGIGAHFVLTRGNWDNLIRQGNVVRELVFTSQTGNSFFKEMSIQGHEDGHVSIFIEFKREDSASITYLLDCGIALSCSQEMVGCYRSTESDTKLLFKILAKYNEIPADKLPLIRELVASGDWRTVTPLKPGESLPSNLWVIRDWSVGSDLLL